MLFFRVMMMVRGHRARTHRVTRKAYYNELGQKEKKNASWPSVTPGPFLASRSRSRYEFWSLIYRKRIYMYEMMRKNAISGNFQRWSSGYSTQHRISDYRENEAEAVLEVLVEVLVGKQINRNRNKSVHFLRLQKINVQTFCHLL